MSKTVFMDREKYLFAGYCIRFPSGYVECRNAMFCDTCELADRMRRQKARDAPLFSWRDALPQTKTYDGETWYGRPVLVSAEALGRNGIEAYAINQVILALDGPGTLKSHPCGEIDGVLFCDKSRRVTVTRNECYGIPNERTVRIYDEQYYLGLRSYFSLNKVK